MTVKRGGLGRNLSVLLGQNETVMLPDEGVKLQKLSVEKLHPGKYQPRTEMDETTLGELAESIKKQGLLQPLVVREVGTDRFEIIAGERRWRACQLAGMTEVPVILRQVDDETAMAIALVENLQREDLNAMEQARAMHRLTTEFALTHQQVAELLSKSRAAVSNYLRLLNLCTEVRRMVEHGDLDMGHARCLLILEEEQQRQVAQLILAKGLSVREAEALVARVKSGVAIEPKSKEKTELPSELSAHVHALAQHLQTKIKIRESKGGRGSLVIEYNDPEMLENLLRQLSEL
jgi:ParB family chromosome partitioning protein